MTITVHGYRYSVYNRIVLMALREIDIPYDTVEINPFADDIPQSHLALHPFGRVPILTHDGFSLYETAAILRYIDTTFNGARLVPPKAKQAARMAQTISIADNYGYWPMVRQVFSHQVFRPFEGLPSDEIAITQGLEQAKHVLTVLEGIAQEGYALDAQNLTLADIHLAPIIGYFVMVQEGDAMLKTYEALSTWWHFISHRSSFVLTAPSLKYSNN
jgi:glutathione S-transferase